MFLKRYLFPNSNLTKRICVSSTFTVLVRRSRVQQWAAARRYAAGPPSALSTTIVSKQFTRSFPFVVRNSLSCRKHIAPLLRPHC